LSRQCVSKNAQLIPEVCGKNKFGKVVINEKYLIVANKGISEVYITNEG